MKILLDEYQKHRKFLIENKLVIIGIPEEPTDVELIEWAAYALQRKSDVIADLTGRLLALENKAPT